MMTITGDLNIYPHLSCLSLFFSRNIYVCVYSSKYSNFWSLGLSVSLSLYVCILVLCVLLRVLFWFCVTVMLIL